MPGFCGLKCVEWCLILFLGGPVTGGQEILLCDRKTWRALRVTQGNKNVRLLHHIPKIAHGLWLAIYQIPLPREIVEAGLGKQATCRMSGRLVDKNSNKCLPEVSAESLKKSSKDMQYGKGFWKAPCLKNIYCKQNYEGSRRIAGQYEFTVEFEATIKGLYVQGKKWNV